MNRNPNAPRIPPMTEATNTVATRRNMLPVIGTGQWSEQAEQVTWLLSHGSTLVCMGPEISAMTAGSNYDLAFKCLPHPQNTKRVWTISFAADETGASGEIQELGGGAVYESFTVPTLFADIPSHTSRIVTFVTDNSADSVDGNGHSEFGIRIAMDAASSGDAFITSLQCTELPVPYVEPGDFPGGTYKYPSVPTLQTGEPVYDDELTPRVAGPAAVQRATKAAETDARRAVLFTCAKHPGVATFSGSYVPVFGAPVPVLARRRYSADGAGNRTIKVWVLADGDGNIRLTAASGDSVVIAVSTAGYEWHVADLMVDAENLATLATDGGLRSGTVDTVLVEFQTAGLLVVRVVMGGEVD